MANYTKIHCHYLVQNSLKDHQATSPAGLEEDKVYLYCVHDKHMQKENYLWKSLESKTAPTPADVFPSTETTAIRWKEVLV